MLVAVSNSLASRSRSALVSNDGSGAPPFRRVPHPDNAAAKVNDKQGDLDTTNAKGAYDVAIAKSDGDRKVAIEKCNSMAGDGQKACKDQADARHDLAEANAKATLAAQKP